MTLLVAGSPSRINLDENLEEGRSTDTAVSNIRSVDAHSWPIAWEILPGNTSDHVSFAGTIAKLRERFKLGRVIVVADRGMISKKSIEMLQGHPTQPLYFILGCRMRNQKEVRDQALSHAGPLKKVTDNLEVHQVGIDDRRYVIFSNPIEARKDAAARDAIIAKLEAKLPTTHRELTRPLP